MIHRGIEYTKVEPITITMADKCKECAGVGDINLCGSLGNDCLRENIVWEKKEKMKGYKKVRDPEGFGCEGCVAEHTTYKKNTYQDLCLLLGDACCEEDIIWKKDEVLISPNAGKQPNRSK